MQAVKTTPTLRLLRSTSSSRTRIGLLRYRRIATREPSAARAATATSISTPTAPASRTPTTHFHTTTSPAARPTMSSDAAYEAFLNKANEDVSGPPPQSQGQGKAYGTKSVHEGVEVPEELRALERESVGGVYSSESDEGWVGVGIGLQGKLSADSLKSSLAHDGEVEELSIEAWDPRRAYAKIVDAVRGVVEGGKVRVFRVGLEGVRCEYWVVGVREGDVVGVKALSVES